MHGPSLAAKNQGRNAKLHIHPDASFIFKPVIPFAPARKINLSLAELGLTSLVSVGMARDEFISWRLRVGVLVQDLSGLRA